MLQDLDLERYLIIQLRLDVLDDMAHEFECEIFEDLCSMDPCWARCSCSVIIRTPAS